jgi:hypothetical protein
MTGEPRYAPVGEGYRVLLDVNEKVEAKKELKKEY